MGKEPTVADIKADELKKRALFSVGASKALNFLPSLKKHDEELSALFSDNNNLNALNVTPEELEEFKQKFNTSLAAGKKSENAESTEQDPRWARAFLDQLDADDEEKRKQRFDNAPAFKEKINDFTRALTSEIRAKDPDFQDLVIKANGSLVIKTYGKDLEIKVDENGQLSPPLKLDSGQGPLTLSFAKVRSDTGRNMSKEKAVYDIFHYDKSGKLVAIISPKGEIKDYNGVECVSKISNLPALQKQLAKNRGFSVAATDHIKKHKKGSSGPTLITLDAAATTIQKVVRGLAGRTEAKKVKEEKEAQIKQQDAAATIQRVYRGTKVRKQVKENAALKNVNQTKGGIAWDIPFEPLDPAGANKKAILKKLNQKIKAGLTASKGHEAKKKKELKDNHEGIRVSQDDGSGTKDESKIKRETRSLSSREEGDKPIVRPKTASSPKAKTREEVIDEWKEVSKAQSTSLNINNNGVIISDGIENNNSNTPASTNQGSYRDRRPPPIDTKVVAASIIGAENNTPSVNNAPVLPANQDANTVASTESTNVNIPAGVVSSNITEDQSPTNSSVAEPKPFTIVDDAGVSNAASPVVSIDQQKLASSSVRATMSDEEAAARRQSFIEKQQNRKRGGKTSGQTIEGNNAPLGTFNDNPSSSIEKWSVTVANGEGVNNDNLEQIDKNSVKKTALKITPETIATLSEAVKDINAVVAASDLKLSGEQQELLKTFNKKAKIFSDGPNEESLQSLLKVLGLVNEEIKTFGDVTSLPQGDTAYINNQSKVMGDLGAGSTQKMATFAVGQSVAPSSAGNVQQTFAGLTGGDASAAVGEEGRGAIQAVTTSLDVNSSTNAAVPGNGQQTPVNQDATNESAAFTSSANTSNLNQGLRPPQTKVVNVKLAEVTLQKATVQKADVNVVRTTRGKAISNNTTPPTDQLFENGKGVESSVKNSIGKAKDDIGVRYGSDGKAEDDKFVPGPMAVDDINVGKRKFKTSKAQKSLTSNLEIDTLSASSSLSSLNSSNFSDGALSPSSLSDKGSISNTKYLEGTASSKAKKRDKFDNKSVELNFDKLSRRGSISSQDTFEIDGEETGSPVSSPVQTPRQSNRGYSNKATLSQNNRSNSSSVVAPEALVEPSVTAGKTRVQAWGVGGAKVAPAPISNEPSATSVGSEILSTSGWGNQRKRDPSRVSTQIGDPQYTGAVQQFSAPKKKSEGKNDKQISVNSQKEGEEKTGFVKKTRGQEGNSVAQVDDGGIVAAYAYKKLQDMSNKRLKDDAAQRKAEKDAIEKAKNQPVGAGSEIEKILAKRQLGGKVNQKEYEKQSRENAEKATKNRKKKMSQATDYQEPSSTVAFLPENKDVEPKQVVTAKTKAQTAKEVAAIAAREAWKDKEREASEQRAEAKRVKRREAAKKKAEQAKAEGPVVEKNDSLTPMEKQSFKSIRGADVIPTDPTAVVLTADSTRFKPAGTLKERYEDDSLPNPNMVSDRVVPAKSRNINQPKAPIGANGKGRDESKFSEAAVRGVSVVEQMKNMQTATKRFASGNHTPPVSPTKGGRSGGKVRQ